MRSYLTPRFTKIPATLALSTLSACSMFGNGANTQNIVSLGSGTVVVSRLAPQILQGGSPNMSDPAVESKLLAFMPIRAQMAQINRAQTSEKWLLLNRETRSISLMQGDSPVATIKGEMLSSLEPGRYKIVHKQKNPSWYAPDEYFSRRTLPVPGKTAKERFRKGALGEYAMYLTKDTPIHCSPFSSDEVGGIRLSEEEITQLYYQLSVGSEIEVK